MSVVFNNSCRFNAASAGTASFVVASAVSGCLTPEQALAIDGKAYFYCAQASDGSGMVENGSGAYGYAGHTLARTTITSTSNGNTQPVNFAAPPIVDVFPSPPPFLEAKSSLVSINYYTSSQSITIPPGATKALVKMWGGTGGSGGVLASVAGSNDIQASSGGTGGAGYLEKFLSGLVAGNTFSFTCGQAGAPGSSSPTNGGNGTASVLASGSQSIATLTANGSNGSLAKTNTEGVPTVGGTASGGDLNLTGSSGGRGGIASLTDSSSFTVLQYVVTTPAPGFNNFSSGAPGAAVVAAPNATSAAGNAGSAGGLIIEWFA